MREIFKVNIYIETDAPGVKKQYRTYGVIVEFLLKNGQPETRDTYGTEEATANHIMLLALIDALEILTKPCDITIYMENKYVSESIRQGRQYEWLANGWKTVRNEPIANAEEWRRLIELLEGHEVTFAYAQTHSYKERLQYDIKKIRDQGTEWRQQRLD